MALASALTTWEEARAAVGSALGSVSLRAALEAAEPMPPVESTIACRDGDLLGIGLGLEVGVGGLGLGLGWG